LVASFPADGKLEVDSLSAEGEGAYPKARWCLAEDIASGPGPDQYMGFKVAMHFVVHNAAAAELWCASPWQNSILHWELASDASKWSQHTYAVPLPESVLWGDKHFVDDNTGIRFDVQQQKLYIVHCRSGDGTYLLTLSPSSGSWNIKKLTAKVLGDPQTVAGKGGGLRLLGNLLGDDHHDIVEESGGAQRSVSGRRTPWEFEYAVVDGAYGEPHVFYTARLPEGYEVVHAYEHADEWVQEKVETVRAGRISACSDAEGHMYVAYFDYANSVVKWAADETGPWTIHQIGEAQAVASTSIACLKGRVAVAYADVGRGGFYLAVRHSASTGESSP
jgi:hypothetical protein